MKLNLFVVRVEDHEKIPVAVRLVDKADFEKTAHSGWQTNWKKMNFRTVCKRYNIDPSKANRLEYDFVTRVAESEFYLQRAAT